ncbi:complex I NDUFA9 subunit family protein [Komagataeibacter rhaeticus]|nr:complex I NDUFA9 subunit family protein [Komagataeibacter rhaeticus]
MPVVASIMDEAGCVAALEGCDLAINLVGILSPRGPATFEAIHVEGAARVARLAACAGVERLIHVSALGADVSSPSAYARSKAEGECAVTRAMPGAVIIRPRSYSGWAAPFPPCSRAWRASCRWCRCSGRPPVSSRSGWGCGRRHAAPCNRWVHGRGRVRIGGPRIMTMRQIVAWSARWAGHPRPLFEVPRWLANAQASVLEHLPGKVLTRDQVRLLYVDNVVAPGARTIEMLGITPAPMDLILG